MAAMRPTAARLRVNRDSGREQILSAQLRFLYANANLGAVVNILAATILGALQWGMISKSVIIGWWLYITLVSVVQCAFARRYWHASPTPTDLRKWRTVFTVGVGLAGTGWGAAGVLLYPADHLTNQGFLVFVLGGMMLGASSLLAPRPEAFLTFLIPAGFTPSVRLFFTGDKAHLAMGAFVAFLLFATMKSTEQAVS